MTFFPNTLETQIIAKWHELSLFQTYHMNETHLTKTIESLSKPLLQCVEDLHRLPVGTTYRVLEFGCADNLKMFYLIFSIALIYGKTIMYVGMEKQAEGIKWIDSTIKKLPVTMQKACQFIHADGSKFEHWYEQLLVKEKFHAAVFIRPKFECPYFAAAEWGINTRIPRREEGRAQFYQFIVMFKLLKECLHPNASILMQVCWSQEYSNFLISLNSLTETKTLQDLPKNVDNDYSFAVRFKPQ